jgi:3-isopropylmalate/(R)-2-methylmalate dehydratase small subunit
MEAFVSHSGLAAPLMRNNVDTDQIIPTRFLARPSEEGLGDGLFAEWRVNPDGTPNTGFILNREPWTHAEILVAGPNFGCGSSREAAPRALRQRGFRAIIAPSFGDIFYGNCFRCGIVPVRLAPEAVEAIAADLGDADAPGQVGVNLLTEEVTGPRGQVFRFETPKLLRRMLLEGQDEIGLTLTQSGTIEAFRAADRGRRPWAYAAKTAAK